MLDGAGAALVLLIFLSTAIERGIEIVLAPLEGWTAPSRRVLAVGLALVLGAAIAYGLQLDLVGPLLAGGGLSTVQARGVTAIALAGGSAPAHELLRLIEEAKTRVKAGG